MFDIGWTELLVVGIVALIVIGPRELPKTLRTIGQMMTKVRRMASEFQGQFNDAIREAELDELRKEAEKLTNIKNPLGDLESIKNEIESAVKDTPKPAAPPTPAIESAEQKPEAATTETVTEPASGGARPS
jgi:sec-independent protein translocase protein TatB